MDKLGGETGQRGFKLSSGNPNTVDSLQYLTEMDWSSGGDRVNTVQREPHTCRPIAVTCSMESPCWQSVIYPSGGETGQRGLIVDEGRQSYQPAARKLNADMRHSLPLLGCLDENVSCCMIS